MIDLKHFMFVGLAGATLTLGCKKHAAPDSAGLNAAPEPSSNSAPAVSPNASAEVSPQPAPPPAVAITGGDVATTLNQLTRELRRTIARTRRLPTGFDDFVSMAQVQVPPAPAGKKYVISKQWTVVLEDL